MARQFIHNFLAIDPGVNTGWAYWGEDDRLDPRYTGVFHAPKAEMGLEQRLKEMYSQFQRLVEWCKPLNFVIIEGTEDWGTAQSRVSSASGALQLLSYLVGGYAALSPAFIIRMPREWKGGLNKKALELRIERALGNGVRFPEHTREAVGLGLSLLEVL